MKNFKKSEFHEISLSGKVNLGFEENSHVAKFYYNHENVQTDKIITAIETDMIKDMEIYVRVILNVQLFGYQKINTLKEFCKEKISAYVESLTDKEIDLNNAVSTSGPVWKGKKVESWIYADIPFINGDNKMINSYINDITAEYRNICEEVDVDIEDMFSIVKFVAKVRVTNYEDAYNLLMISNFQKPNNYVDNTIIHINTPNAVSCDKYTNDTRNSKDDSTFGYSFNIKSEECEEIYEVVFDDRVKVNEMSVQRFVSKSEKLTLPHFTSRSVMIFKKDKTRPLIKNNNGVIEVGTIIFDVKEHPKTTGFFGDFISKFLKSNSKLSQKTIRSLSHIIGKVITNKIIVGYNKNES